MMATQIAPPAAEVFVRISNVGKVFRREGPSLEVLQNVSIAVASRQFISILGASGCGKTTLLMMLAGLEPISSGSIEIAGQIVKRPRRDVGIICQDTTLLPWKTALENVLFPIEIFGLSMTEYRTRAQALLELVALSDAMTRDELNVMLLDIWERYHQTAFFVTHSIREAVFLSDRVVVLGGSPGQI